MTRDDSRPTLADLAADPAPTAEVDLDRVPDLLGDLQRLRAMLWACLALRINHLDSKEDRLVGVEEAAATLGTTRDWRRRHGARMPFTVRLSAGQVRYSAKGIDIASRVGGRGR